MFKHHLFVSISKPLILSDLSYYSYLSKTSRNSFLWVGDVFKSSPKLQNGLEIDQNIFRHWFFFPEKAETLLFKNIIISKREHLKGARYFGFRKNWLIFSIYRVKQKSRAPFRGFFFEIMIFLKSKVSAFTGKKN